MVGRPRLPTNVLARMSSMLDRETVLSMLLVCKAFHTLASPYAYERVKISTSDAFEQLLSVVEKGMREPLMRHALSSIRKLEFCMDVPDDPSPTPEEQVNVPEATAPPNISPVDPTSLSVERLATHQGAPTALPGASAEDHAMPPSPATAARTDRRARRPPAALWSLQHQPELEPGDLQLPKVFFSAKRLRAILASIVAARKKAYQSIWVRSLQNGRLQRPNWVDFSFPLSNVVELIIRPMEYPAAPLSSMTPPYLAPFQSLKRLHLHIKLGHIARNVLLANESELTCSMPMVEELFYHIESDSVFSAGTFVWSGLLYWPKLRREHIYIDCAYRSSTYGEPWHMGSTLGNHWLRRILQVHANCAAALHQQELKMKAASRGDQVGSQQQSALAQRQLDVKLHVPPQSRFSWNLENLIDLFHTRQVATCGRQIVLLQPCYAEEVDT